MKKTLRSLAGYLFYKERVEKQLKNQEPMFLSSYTSEDKFQKGLSSSKARTIEPPEVIGRDKNGEAVSFSRQYFSIGPGYNRAAYKVVKSSSGNNITISLSLLAAYTRGYIEEGYAQGTTSKQTESFLKSIKSYESSAKSLLNRHDGSFKNFPSFVVMEHSFVATNMKSMATSTRKNKEFEKSSKNITSKVVTSTYFTPIINGKQIPLPKVEAAARQLREEETKKWIPFEPIATNYDKSQMAGVAEINTHTRGITMELTKRRLKEIIAEEMNHLAETGDLNMITEAEKKAFEIILEKLTPKQLEDLGLRRI